MTDFTGFFILICWLIFCVSIIISASYVKRTTELDNRWKWGWLVLTLVVAAAIILLSHINFDQTTLWPRSFAINIVADISLFVGLFIALAGRFTLGRNWNLNPGLKENHELIERGPYAYVRHPMYSGLLLMLLGTILWYATLIGLIFFVACFFGTWLKLRREEKILTAHFGRGYAEYKTRVRALIPFVW